MTGNGGPTGSDLACIDAYENTAADCEEIPDVSEVDMSLVTWKVGDRVVGEAEGRAEGPDWRDRMADALRKAVGL